jgi:pimeloyl-ACP methyl ester carboxylesterase
MTKFRVLLPVLFGATAMGLLGLLDLAGCSGANKDYCYFAGTCSDTEPDLSSGGGDVDLRMGDGKDGGTNGDGGGKLDLRGRPRVDPGVAGPYRTAQFDLSLDVTGSGTTRFTVIGPSDDGMKLTMRGAPFPLVLFSPGFMIDHKLYTSYGARLGSHGIVTVLQKVPAEYDHGRYRDNTVELLNWLLNPTGRDAERVKGFFDATRVGLSGHSLGGKIGLLVAARDARVKAFFGIDPVDSTNTPAGAEVGKIKFPGGAPVAFVGETASKMGRPPCAPAESNYEVLYGKASAPAFAITMKETAHLDWVDGCTYLCTNICPGGGSETVRSRTRSLTAKYIAAYFLWTLGGDPDVHEYLDGAPFQKDVDAGYASAVAK